MSLGPHNSTASLSGHCFLLTCLTEGLGCGMCTVKRRKSSLILKRPSLILSFSFQILTAEMLRLMWSYKTSASRSWICLSWQWKCLWLSFHVGVDGQWLNHVLPFCCRDTTGAILPDFLSQWYFWEVLCSILHILGIFFFACFSVSCTLSSSAFILILINWNIPSYFRVSIPSMKQKRWWDNTFASINITFKYNVLA